MSYEKENDYTQKDVRANNEIEIDFWYEKSWELNEEIDALNEKLNKERNATS